MYDQKSEPQTPRTAQVAQEIAKSLLNEFSHEEQVYVFSTIKDILLKERSNHIESNHSVIKEATCKIEEIQRGNDFIKGVDPSASLKPAPNY